MVSVLQDITVGRKISKLTTILHDAKCYGEESQGISTIKIQHEKKIQHGIQRRLLEGGVMCTDNW